MITRIAFALAFIAVSGVSFAQVAQMARFELPLEEKDEVKYLTAGLAENGLMAYRRVGGRKEDHVELIKVDTSLHETWRGSIPIDKRLDVMHVRSFGNLFFLLLKDRERLGRDFQIFAVNMSSGNYGMYSVKNIIPFYPTEFVLTSKAALIGGYFNNRPLVLFYNFESQSSRILPGFFNSPGELNQIKVNSDGTTDIVVSARNFEKRRALWIRTYDPFGELVRTTVIQPDEDKHLIFGRSMVMPGGRQLVAGVYGRFTEYSRGVFVATIEPTGEYAIQYHNFAQLKNFFNYMKAKQQKRVKDRIERKKIKGKKLKFNYRLVVHDLIAYNNQLLLVGEAFYPHYIYPRMGDPRFPHYNPQARTNRVFDGYKYTHAVVIGFGKDGQLLWDNSFEINDVKTFQLQQFVKVQPTNNRILLMYLFENAIRTKIILDDQVLEGKATDKLKPGATGEELDRDFENTDTMDNWYGKYFYAYGTQTLKGRRGSRKVFFINKITYN
ncbi:MAG: hypothetical protein JNK10_02275 [Cyclobacteriaceae bacterium]|nr:hypothetical protein [Cyclobacteriaceae bacterium]